MKKQVSKRTVCHWEFGGCWQWFWLVFWILFFFPLAIVYYFAKRRQICEEIDEVPVRGEVR